jgi:hypothetical protein
MVKEVSEDALPKNNVLNVRAKPDVAVQKNIEYLRNLGKIRAERERQQKEH